MEEEKTSETLLIVDDDPLTLTSLRMMFRKQGYEVVVASNAREAQQSIQERGTMAFHCMLTDFRMPGMNGLQLVDWLGKQDADLAVIILTAEGDKDVVTNALREGVCDYIEKPYRFAQVRDAVQRAIEQTERARKVHATVTQVREITQLQEHLNETSRQGITSDETSEWNLSLVTRMHPIKETGGDFINTSTMPDGRLCVILADISGHDLKAGFISAYFQGMVRGMLDMNASITQVCQQFNQHLISDWNERGEENKQWLKTSLACCILLLDTQTGAVECYNHGIPNPLYVESTKQIHLLGNGNPPLGWFPDISHIAEGLRFNDPGCITIWSDGLEEHANKLGICHTTLAWMLTSESDRTARQKILDQHTDDVLVAGIYWNHHQTGPHHTTDWSPLFYEAYSGDSANEIDQHESLVVRSIQYALPALDEGLLKDIQLCIREALLNALTHGTKGSSHLRAMLTLFLNPNHSELLVSVRDEGEGYDHEQIKKPALPPENTETNHISFGMEIIRNICQKVENKDHGRHLNMYFSL